jgi:hypothetical protein
LHPLERPVFSVDASEYRWVDVVLAMPILGTWPAFERRLIAGLACERRDRRGEEMPARAVAEEERRFRQARNLWSAEDAEAWLTERDIGVGEWKGWVRREAMARAWRDRLDEIVAAEAPSEDEVDDLVWVDGVCSGALPANAERLAGHLAIHGWARDQESAPAADHRPLDEAVAQIPPRWRACGLPGLPPGDVPSRARVLAEAVASARVALDEVATPEALSAEVAAHASAWLRADLEVAVFDREPVAREAALVVGEDGGTLRDAADMAGVALATRSVFLGDVEPGLRSRLLAAPPGRPIGPLPVDGGYQVTTVVRRVEPSLDDPRVRSSALDAVAGRFAEREVASRVRWHDRI